MFQRFVIHSLTKRCSNKKRFPFIDQVLPSVTNDFLFHFLSSFFFIIVFFFKFQPLISFFEEEVKSLVTACWILVLELCTCQLMSPMKRREREIIWALTYSTSSKKNSTRYERLTQDGHYLRTNDWESSMNYKH